MTALTLSELYIYPIKSAAGNRLKTALLTPRGLQSDRRYMVVEPNGRFMTQRRFPKMALIQVKCISTDAGFQLAISAPGMSSLSVAQPDATATKVVVEVWGDRTPALSCGPTASSWLSKFLSTPCQLVYMPDASLRPTDHGKFGPANIVSFADAYPYLLLSEASLAALNQKLIAQRESPVSMNRFRPNLVVSGDMAPHAEDDWKRIRIGETIFDVAKPCARCSIPNVSQDGDRTREPGRTLATYRTWDKAIWFGQNLIQADFETGSLKVGDEVEILA